MARNNVRNNINPNDGNVNNNSGNEPPNSAISGTVEPTGNDNFTIAEPAPTGTGEPIKRKRGRPRKTEKIISENDTQNFDVSEQKKRGRPKKSTSKTEAIQTTALILGMLETASSVMLNKDTTLNDFERGLIEPNLQNLIERSSFGAIEKFNKIVEPALIVGGLVLWLSRVAKPVTVNRKNENSGGQNGTQPPDINNETANFDLNSLLR